jgi:hypothetical protein
MLDNVFRWNVRSVLRNLHEAQVVSLYFPYLGRALIIDFRTDKAEGPLIAIDTLVSGPQERIESLKRLRPRFETPDTVAVSPWLGPVRTLESSGALAQAAKRLQRLGWVESELQLAETYDRLKALERSEILALIRGDVERTKTLYQR